MFAVNYSLFCESPTNQTDNRVPQELHGDVCVCVHTMFVINSHQSLQRPQWLQVTLTQVGHQHDGISLTRERSSCCVMSVKSLLQGAGTQSTYYTSVLKDITILDLRSRETILCCMTVQTCDLLVSANCWLKKSLSDSICTSCVSFYETYFSVIQEHHNSFC